MTSIKAKKVILKNRDGEHLIPVVTTPMGTYKMFDPVLQDHILTYEETKGLALQGTYVYKEAVAGERYGYPTFYEKCVEEKEAATATETTLGDNTITMYINANGHQFYDIADKEAVDAWYDTYGRAWFYGIDTENERIFLPRNNSYFRIGDETTVGTNQDAGLPNITGWFGAGGWEKAEASGALSVGTTFSDYGAGHTTTNPSMKIVLDASRSSAIYGNSDTVELDSVNMLLYICVGNTESDTSWVDVVTQVEGGVKDLEDKKELCIDEIESVGNSYDNITYRNITNCLLEIPQNIKLDLTDGVLTLQAGSKFIVPNGFEEDGATLKFDEKVITQDISMALGSSTGVRTLTIGSTAWGSTDTGTSYFDSGAAIYSGATQPTTTMANSYWYDTANNVIKTTADTGATWVTGTSSFPFAVVTANAGAITSIDQIFNGVGYVGSTLWVDKGVKGLIPNGRNADGTLNTVEFEAPTVIVGSRNLSQTSIPVWYRSDNVLVFSKGAEHIEETNTIFGTDGKTYSYCQIATVDMASGIISNLQPKRPFRAIDYNDNNLPQVDGQWVYSYTQLGTEMGTYSLADYLPDDGYNYDVKFRVQGYTSSDSTYQLYCQTDVYGEIFVMFGGGASRQNTQVYDMPVGVGRSVTFSGTKGETLYLNATGYRRIGRNA